MLYICQMLTCDWKNQGRRYLDLVPVVAPRKMDMGTQETSAQIAGLNLTLGLVLSDPSEGLQSLPFGDCWIEQVMRRKILIKATRI